MTPFRMTVLGLGLVLLFTGILLLLPTPSPAAGSNLQLIGQQSVGTSTLYILRGSYKRCVLLVVSPTGAVAVSQENDSNICP
jgi:hypothetical protein